MRVICAEDPTSAGQKAADEAYDVLSAALKAKGKATIVMATGMTQFPVLERLIKSSNGGADSPRGAEEVLDWTNVTCFHLDEYIGIGGDHSASFQLYFRERFLAKLVGDNLPRAFNFISAPDPAEAACKAECERLQGLITEQEVDLVLLGIGDNGHLAFNDPPADFEAKESFLVVDLDEKCRQQQFGQGWFDTLDAVPKRAITMSISQILKGKHLICIATSERKAGPIAQTIPPAKIDPMCPSSALQGHPNCSLYVDTGSSSTLSPEQKSWAAQSV